MFHRLPIGLLVGVLFLAGCTAGAQPAQESGGSAEIVAPTIPVANEKRVEGNAPAAPSNTIAAAQVETNLYPVVDTGQSYCYDAHNSIPCPAEGEAFYGQDAQIRGNAPSYTDNGDGTVTDNVTGLMWQQDPGDKMTYDEAVAGAASFSLAGYDDWRLPTIKELYSLILFSGYDPSGLSGGTSELTPFIDTETFMFEYGDESVNERIIDSQFISSTEYVSTTMGGNKTVFGVNFADGRIKGYPVGAVPGQTDGKLFFVLYVRGNPDYGVNDFADNGDGTITDWATGLTWMQADSGTVMDWEEALAYCQQADIGGYVDWYLPNAKELQSIVDYNRSPLTSQSAAIDPLFQATPIVDERGGSNYGFYWSSTTHANMMSGDHAAYVSFGEALGYMNGSWMDVHGAGAQRSDPKVDSAAQYPTGHGPQGDAIRGENLVRCVRSDTEDALLVGGAVDEQYSGSSPQTGLSASGGNPPQPAVDACSELSVYDGCTFTTPSGTMGGVCSQTQSGLACGPAGTPPNLSAGPLSGERP